jgi:hypothetical protein
MAGLVQHAIYISRGEVGNFNFFTFTLIRKGLIDWSFEIPDYAYCQAVSGQFKDRHAQPFYRLKNLLSTQYKLNRP